MKRYMIPYAHLIIDEGWFVWCFWIKRRAKLEVFQAWFGFDSYEKILVKNLS